MLHAEILVIDHFIMVLHPPETTISTGKSQFFLNNLYFVGMDNGQWAFDNGKPSVEKNNALLKCIYEV